MLRTDYRCLLLPGSGEPEAQESAQPAWSVELAITEEQQYRGLSNRPFLEAHRGMLFVFSKPGPLTFCMRGCLISLDIAFISANMRVVRVETMMAEPHGQERRRYSSGGPALYALEVNAGELGSSGVRAGDRACFSDELERRVAEILGRCPARE